MIKSFASFLLATLACCHLFAAHTYIPITEEKALWQYSLEYLQGQPSPSYTGAKISGAIGTLSLVTFIALPAMLCTLIPPKHEWQNASTACEVGAGVGSTISGLISLLAWGCFIESYWGKSEKFINYKKSQDLAQLIQHSYNLNNQVSLSYLHNLVENYRIHNKKSVISAQDLGYQVQRATEAGYFSIAMGFINKDKLKELVIDNEAPRPDIFLKDISWLGTLANTTVVDVVAYLLGNPAYALGPLETQKAAFKEAFTRYNNEIAHFLKDVENAENQLFQQIPSI